MTGYTYWGQGCVEVQTKYVFPQGNVSFSSVGSQLSLPCSLVSSIYSAVCLCKVKIKQSFTNSSNARENECDSVLLKQQINKYH